MKVSKVILVKDKYIIIVVLTTIATFFFFYTSQSKKYDCTSPFYANFMAFNNPCNTLFEGLGSIEGEKPFRWAYGPMTTITFISTRIHDCFITYQISNVTPNQTLQIYANETLLKEYVNIPIQHNLSPWVSARLKFTTIHGINKISFKYKYWSHNGFVLNNSDSRPFALAFTKLQLFAPSR
jgi:hypothetical protein